LGIKFSKSDISFFASNQAGVTERQPEFYQNIKMYDPRAKYDLVDSRLK
jgi:hypothetical protein